MEEVVSYINLTLSELHHKVYININKDLAMELKGKLDKYIKLTEKAFKKIKIKTPKDIDLKKVAEDFLDLANRYYQDALYFKEKGKLLEAFAAINYSHAFLDAGARLKVFDVKDSKLFMVDDE